MTPMDFKKMKKYIGIDVKPCFSELKTFKAYIYSKTVHFSPKHLYVTERGPNKTSLDYYLFKIAQNDGVNFEFSHPLTQDTIESIPDGSIIGTGSYSRLFKHLKLDFDQFIHFDSHMKIKDKLDFCIAFFNTYMSGYGYAYIAAKNGFASVEVDFVLTQPYEKHLEKFKKQLKENENLEFNKWSFMIDNIPKKINIFKKLHGKTFVLTGALSGFHDPFFGFGVNSALISGKIAATTVISKKRGIKELKRFSNDLDKMYILSKIYNHIPLKSIFIPQLFKSSKSIVPFVGRNLRNIPGFTHDDCFDIVSIDISC